LSEASPDHTTYHCAVEVLASPAMGIM